MATDHERIWGRPHFERAQLGEIEPPHQHEVPLLACLESGLLDLRTEFGSWVVFPKTVIFVPSGFVHTTVMMSSELSGWILFLPESRAVGLGNSPRVLEMSDVFVALCQRIVSWGEAGTPTPAQERIMAVAIDELACARPRLTYRVPLPDGAGLLRVAQAVLAAPGHPAGLVHWAKLAGCSRRSFTRHFMEQTGMSFGAWRKRVQIHAALRLLQAGSSVTEVGFELGYQSTSAFVAMFRKCTGITPARCAQELESGVVDGLPAVRRPT